MISYNLYQVLFNVFWCATVVHLLIQKGQPVLGAALDEGETGLSLAFLIYLHYHNKFIELLDTVFMVLRAKNSQMTFLHCYHHVLMIWAWYAVIKNHCGGDGWFGAWANSFIHILMYGYYLMTALQIPCPWKKVMTQMQMVQFCICFTHAWLCVYYGSVPTWICLVQVYVMINMLVLFGNFYRKKYAANPNPSAGEREAKKAA